MSRVADRIAFYYLQRGDRTFLTPASDFEPEDEYLLKAGVFVKSDKTIDEIMCPFGCGKSEPVHIRTNSTGKTEHFVCCSNSDGIACKILKPKEYELYAFKEDAFIRIGGTCDKKSTTRPERRPRDTKWIKIERRAVLAYANDPKRNTTNLEPYELCETVWAENQAEFDGAAKLPVYERGYANADALRAYFYRQRRLYQTNKYAPQI